MKLLLSKLFIFITLFFYLFTDLSANELKTAYKIELGAINIGSLKWTINIQGNNYRTFMFLEDKGFFSGFYKFSGEYLSEGIFLDGVFIPSRYKQFWKTKMKKREVEILFKKTKVIDLILQPKENEVARIEYLKIEGLVDPLSSFLNILRNSENNFKTIDGRRIYQMSLEVEKNDTNKISKKIYITDYFNIWADHKRNELKYIITKQSFLKKEDKYFPNNIKIKHKGLVFKLTKI